MVINLGDIGMLIAPRPVSAAVVNTVPSLIAKVGAVNSNTASLGNTTGANFLFACVHAYTSQSYTITDTYSNVWNRLSYSYNSFGGDQGFNAPFYAYNASVGANHSITASTNTLYLGVTATAWSNMLASSAVLDYQTGSINNGSATGSAGAITSSQANELILTVWANGNSACAHPTCSAFTMSNNIYNGNDEDGAQAYYIATGSNQKLSPTWLTAGDTNGSSYVVASFKHS